ncbi:MAG: elongation factor G [Planctomycetes bacterium]|nr:elongation factor G [Planctomycetota bacterium]
MAAQKPQDLRNIILLGHGGAGKTTLAEALLHAGGVVNKMGSIDEGTTLMDFDAMEKENQYSIDPAMATISRAGKDINLLDAPGYPDFIGGAVAAIGGADVAVFVVNAAAGIEVNTRRLLKLAESLNLPKAVVVNRIQAENVQFPELMAAIRDTFGSAAKPMNLPAEGGTAVIDCFVNTEGDSALGEAADAQNELMESVIEADEALMEAYLGGEKVSAEQLAAAFSTAMVSGTVVPVLFTDAKAEVGTAELLDAVANYFPSPAQVPGRTIRAGEKEDAPVVDVACTGDKPFIGLAFRVTVDPFVGKLSWVRVMQGTVTPDTTYSIGDARKSSKVSHLFKVQGKDSVEIKQAVAGDIIALAKVEEVVSGAVLHSEGKEMYAEAVPAPTPMFTLAIAPKKRGDEQKLAEAMTRISEEDPTFITTRDAQTQETVISGIGDLHIRIVLAKMKNRFHMEVDTRPPKIPYRETVTVKAEGHHRHKKQTGGAGQFGEVYLRIEPLERGEGFVFEEDIFGGAIPQQFIPAIEKGVRDVLGEGAIAGYPLSDVKVIVYDGKHHPVDSKEVAFRTAGKYAFLDAIAKAKPVLLEPIVNIEVTVPSEYMGDITGDLNGRRGRIMGMDVLPGGTMQVIKAQAPLSEVMTYNSQLRAMTAGQGSYDMEFSHYEPVPGNVQQQIADAAAKAKHESE